MRKRLDVRLPEALDAELRATAAAQDRTVTWVVERALEAALGATTGPVNEGQRVGSLPPAPASPRMPVATANTERRLSKQELDADRQRRLNKTKKGMKA